MAPISEVTLRPAMLDDIPEIASVLVDTWRATFRGLLSDEFLDGLTATQQQARYRKLLNRPERLCSVAADAAGHIIGFASGGPTRSSELTIPAELYALYVRKRAQGNGLGRRLFESIGSDLSRTVGDGLMVWVLENNPARRFYQHLGGVEVARGEALLGKDHVGEIAFAWPSTS